MIQPLEVLAIDGAFLHRETVLRITAFSSATLYRRIAAGEFPKPVKLGPRSSRWPSEDVRAWARAQRQAAASGEVSA